jgi:hypothetical protein
VIPHFVQGNFVQTTFSLPTLVHRQFVQRHLIHKTFRSFDIWSKGLFIQKTICPQDISSISYLAQRIFSPRDFSSIGHLIQKIFRPRDVWSTRYFVYTIFRPFDISSTRQLPPAASMGCWGSYPRRMRK